jgi:cell division protein FtsB
MGVVREIRSRAAQVVGPVIGICVIGYFAYHMLHGDRGLVAWRQLRDRVEEAQRELAAVDREKAFLEHRVRMLRPESLDPDLLDERVRVMLNYAAPD